MTLSENLITHANSIKSLLDEVQVQLDSITSREALLKSNEDELNIKITKEEKLLEEIEIAKQNGTWNALDKISNLELPADLQQAFDNNQQAFSNWQNFPPSVKQGRLNFFCP